jgi:replicative DNA helicase
MAEVTGSLHRLPPQNLEAEASILGGVLLENEAINTVLELVNAEDLYRESHRKIFRAMVDLWDRSEPVDLITLSDQLKANGDLEAVGGSAYLAELAGQVPTAANIAYYARIVREKAILRHLIRASTDIASRGLEERGDVDDFLDDAEQAIFDIAEKRISSSFVRVGDVMTETIKKVDELYQRKEMVTGVATGYRDLDRLTAGFQPSDLLIVAGRPGMGKTAFALNIAVNAAFRGIGVAVFSLEMAMEQLVLRMLCSEARVDHSRLRTGYLRDTEFPALVKAAGRLGDAPVYIDDTPAVTVLEVRAKTRRLVRDRSRKIGLVVIDYLQLMRGHRDSPNREQEISEISRSLKALAKELRVPVVALSQLNRRVEERGDKHPVMADLRESGAIEQDADVIMFVYRDEAYDATKNPGVAEIIIAKQRNGPVDTLKLTFLKEYTRFEDYSGRDDEGYSDAEQS